MILDSGVLTCDLFNHGRSGNEKRLLYQSGNRLTNSLRKAAIPVCGPEASEPHDRPGGLEEEIVSALAIAGFASGTDLAAILCLQDSQVFETCLANVVERGDVVRHLAGNVCLYAAAPARRHHLVGETIHIGPRDQALAESDAPSDDVETLHELLGPPTWRYGAETLEAFALDARSRSFEDERAWLVVAERGAGALDLRHVSKDAPSQVRRLAALTAGWPDASLAALEGPLRIWAGLGREMAADPAQTRVVHLAPGARAIVCAGPGAGKTHTITRRISHLVEAGLPPPAITVIAYSRAAVAELRSRVPAVDGEIVDIRTLDSTAGLLTANATEDIGETDYEGSIVQATRLLQREDRTALGWLGTRRHVIVDEAQDIVGTRRTFLMELVGRLPQACGATVFADPFQAIYGYGERAAGRPDPAAIDADLVETGFARHDLRANHRTTRSTLQRVAAEGRDRLAEAANGYTALQVVRSLVEAVSDGAPPGPGETRPLAGLALFRSGAAAARHAARMGDRKVRVRLIERGEDTKMALAPAWLGRAVNAVQDRGIEALDLLVSEDPSMPSKAKLIDALAVCRSQGRYDMAQMARAMQAGLGPPLERTAAQTVSTIHAAKGREADDVALYLPEAREALSDLEAAEEARVVYVGATRARRRLYVAPESNPMNREGARHWRKSGHGVQVQVRPADAAEMADLAEPDGPIRNPLLRWTRDDGWGLYGEMSDGERRFATFGDAFGRDISTICGKVRPDPFAPVARGQLWAQWCTLARGDALVVAPVVEGFVWINFTRASTP